MRSILYIPLLLAFTSFELLAQSERNSRSHFIILANKDSLSGIEIKTNHNFTNEDRVTYTNQDGIVSKIDAKEINLYFDGKAIYHSVFISGENKFKLINYQVKGYLVFGQSYSKTNRVKYYLILEDLCADISNNKKDIEGFIGDFIPDYETFILTYKGKILYDYKSLAEFTSAYNSFLSPDEFIFVKYKSKEAFRIGAGPVSLSANKLEIEDYQDMNLFGYSIGMNFENEYSHNTSLILAPKFSRKRGNNSEAEVLFSTLQMDVLFGISVYQNSTIKIQFGPGGGVNYHLNSYMKLKNPSLQDREVIEFTKVGFDLDINLWLILYQNHTFILSLGRSWVETGQTAEIVVVDTKKGGTYQGIHLGYSFRF